MNQKPTLTPLNDPSWASALLDGEVDLRAQDELTESWPENAHEQLGYYTVTRQILRGMAPGPEGAIGFQWQRTTWTRFWARVDANPALTETQCHDLS